MFVSAPTSGCLGMLLFCICGRARGAGAPGGVPGVGQNFFKEKKEVKQ